MKAFGAVAVALVGSLSACGGSTEPTTADFCRAVSGIPPGSSVAEAQESFAKVEDNSPPDIRETVIKLLAVIDKARDEEDLDAMDAPGSSTHAATLIFQSYVAGHCKH